MKSKKAHFVKLNYFKWIWYAMWPSLTPDQLLCTVATGSLGVAIVVATGSLGVVIVVATGSFE